MKQTIFITWWAGFIGSNFLNRFVREQPHIMFINIDCLTYSGKLDNIDIDVQCAGNYVFEKCNIRERDWLTKLYQKYSPTDIIHFAAETHVDTSIYSPHIFTETNVLWTHNLLELHREFQLKRFHLISTDEVYGDTEGWLPSTETSLLQPSNPYSASKAAADLLVQAYGRTYGIDWVITRSSNNYGPNQYHEKFIPHSLSLLQNNKNIELYGDGKQVRDWMHVDDHIRALWWVFTRSQPQSLYNISSWNILTNLELAHILLDEMHLSRDRISYIWDRPGHDRRYTLDTSRIERDLSWKPQVSLRDGMISTIDHFLKQSRHAPL